MNGAHSDFITTLLLQEIFTKKHPSLGISKVKGDASRKKRFIEL